MKQKVFLKIFGLLVLFQIARLVIKQLIFTHIERTNFLDHLVSMFAMILMSGMILFISKQREIRLSIFPSNFAKTYVVGTIVFVLLLASAPSNYVGGLQTIMLLIYSSVVTPIYEELIFRGYIWNRLSVIFKHPLSVYLWSSILFSIWHLGYVDSLAFRVESSLLQALIWKAITGLGYGLVLGLLRWKSGNCYSTMLLHGVMNIFGR
ncbi:MAG: lysostaphin resistance A-like protein [Enterococcus sp.]